MKNNLTPRQRQKKTQAWLKKMSDAKKLMTKFVTDPLPLKGA